MLTSILGARLSWHVGGWVFEPAVVGPDTIDYVLKEARILGGMPSSTSTTSVSRQALKQRFGMRRAARSSI